MARTKQMMQVSVKKKPNGGFTSDYMLPLDSATENDSVNCANALRKAANAQLDYAGSNARLVFYDFEKKQFLKIVE